jgi:hypothetical protein
MNKEDIFKYVLIAGAAYLVYRYLSQSGLFTSLTAQPAAALPAAATVVVPQITAAKTTPDVAQSLITAAKAANYDPNGLYNGYQWNYFWQRAALYNGVDIGPTELGISETSTVPLSEAVKAVNTILATGMKGLDFSRLAQLLPASSWSM